MASREELKKRRILIAINSLIILATITVMTLTIFIPGMQVLELAFGMAFSTTALAVFLLGIIAIVLFNAGFFFIDWLIKKHALSNDPDHGKPLDLKNMFNPHLFEKPLEALRKSLAPLRKAILEIFLDRESYGLHGKWENSKKTVIEQCLLMRLVEILGETDINKYNIVLYCATATIEGKQNFEDIEEYQFLALLQRMGAPYIKLDKEISKDSNILTLTLYIENEDREKVINLLQTRKEHKENTTKAEQIKTFLQTKLGESFEIRTTKGHEKYADGTVFLVRHLSSGVEGVKQGISISSNINNFIDTKPQGHSIAKTESLHDGKGGSPAHIVCIYENDFDTVLAKIATVQQKENVEAGTELKKQNT